jgi:hypothetical protein
MATSCLQSALAEGKRWNVGKSLRLKIENKLMLVFGHEKTGFKRGSGNSLDSCWGCGQESKDSDLLICASVSQTKWHNLQYIVVWNAT